jgi:hypothetical protein
MRKYIMRVCGKAYKNHETNKCKIAEIIYLMNDGLV